MTEPARQILRVDTEGRIATPRIEALNDVDLRALNELLPWQCFTLDRKGAASASQPQRSSATRPK